AFRISQIVGTIAQLGIPDQLAGGAWTAGELASLTGCHAGATHRLMRAASDLGLVTSGADDRFILTALGQSLRSDVPGSVRDAAIALTAPGHWLPWGRLSEAVRTGRRQTRLARSYLNTTQTGLPKAVHSLEQWLCRARRW